MRWVFIPKQPEESVFGGVGAPASFWSLFAPCLSAMALAPDTKSYVAAAKFPILQLFRYILFLPLLFWAEEPLVVGMELAYPPFETIDFEGDPDGFSPALAKHLAEFLDRPLQIESIPFVGLIPALRAGKIDLIISSMTATEEREKAIAFSDPYIEIALCLLISDRSNLKSVADANFPKRRIAVKMGTTGADWALAHLQRAKIRVLDQESSCILEVVQGKADAFIYDQISIWRAWQRNRSATRVNLYPIQTEHWSIGLRKEDDELKEQVNAFLRAFREEGGFEALADEYLGKEKRAFAQMKIPFVLYSSLD